MAYIIIGVLLVLILRWKFYHTLEKIGHVFETQAEVENSTKIADEQRQQQQQEHQERQRDLPPTGKEISPEIMIISDTASVNGEDENETFGSDAASKRRSYAFANDGKQT